MKRRSIFPPCLSMSNRHSRYFSDLSINIGLIVPVKLALWMLCMLLMAHSAMYQEFLSSIHASEKFDVRISYIIYLFGLLLVSLGYFFPTFIERISWYFYVYEGVFYKGYFMGPY